MRILLNVWCRSGHLNTSISLAKHLVTSGDTVEFFCADNGLQQRIREAGLNVECVAMGPPTDDKSRIPHSPNRLWLTRRLQDPEWRLIHWEGLLVHAAAREVPFLQKVISAFGPDIVCTDGMSYSGAIAAEREGVPWVTIANTWDFIAPPDYCGCALRETLNALDPVRRQMSASFGLRLAFRWNQVVSPYLNLTFCIEQLLPSGSGHHQTELVGPCRIDNRGDECTFPWELLDPTRPLVYMSCGTEFQFEPDVVKYLAEAAVSEGAQVVLAGCAYGGLLDTCHNRVISVDYAPQLELLKRARLFVTHGGDNSVMEGLMAGVPLLVLPLVSTQPITATYVAQIGCGRVIDPWNKKYCEYPISIRELLAPFALERARAKAIQAILEELDGGCRAAELVHRVATQHSSLAKTIREPLRM